MKTKNNLVTLATVVATVILSCGLLSAQSNSKYYDPAQFYTLDAAQRSDDGRARVIQVPDDEYEFTPVLQILTADGKIVSSDGFSRFGAGDDPKCLRSVKTLDGNTVYLYIQGQSRYENGSVIHSDWVSAFRIGKNGKMEQVPFFKTSKALLKEIVCDWRDDDSTDWCYGWLEAGLDVNDFFTDCLGISYHAETSSLYVPLIEKNDNGSYSKKYTNRFIVYQFDGNAFVYKGREAPYWLHSSLKDFQSTEFCFMTNGYLVQVDKLKDGSYRYASWKDGCGLMDMGRKPSLVLRGGSFKNDRYTFTNNSHTYIVDLKESTLVVKNSGKTILEREIYW